MTSPLKRVEKRVKLRGKVISVVREQYLRNDIVCHSSICDRCTKLPKNPSSKETELWVEATHYVIPAYDVFERYLEIFELPMIKGFLILQSIALKVLQALGKGHYKRILSLARNRQRGCAVFLNEICEQTYTERSDVETEEDWLVRSVLNVATYYDEHLNGAVPIIVVTEKPELFLLADVSVNVQVLTLEAYLESKSNSFEEAIGLYKSITIANASLSNGKDDSKAYDNYLPPSVLHSGIKAGRYFKGRLRVNKHMASQEAYVASSVLHRKEAGDILIVGMKHRNRAIHGDEVVVEMLPRSEWKSKSFSLTSNSGESKESLGGSEIQTGKVVGILERKWRDYVATIPDENEDKNNLSKSNTERILVVPYDYRIPRIRIATKQADLLRNERIIVRIDNWEKASHYPNGHFVRSIGEVGKFETEIKCLLVENGIADADFPLSLMPELPDSTAEKPWLVEEAEVAKRRDLRQSHLIFSIDPRGCEDVDDTLSVKKLPNGEIELGVHIADVTYFVKPSSLTDLEARCRSTSVYLPDRRYDMLPQVLGADVCSLLGNVDRYALSVMWNLDSDFNVQKVWYGRTVIRSSYKLCYEDAEELLHDGPVEEMQKKIPELQKFDGDKLLNQFDELKSAVRDLATISKVFRAKRLDAGGLELNTISVKFVIDKSLPSLIKEVQQVQELEVHKTVAECMIFANSWVAKQISEVFPQQAVLRHHPNPREPDLMDVQKLAASRGFTLRINSNKELAQSLEQASDSDDPAVNQIFRILATRSMNEATYFCTGSVTVEDFYHYGLAITHYTHFTSPIRRYSDVLVHRLLLASVNEDPITNVPPKVSDLEAMCDHMNLKHRSSRDAEKAAQELFQAFYFDELARECPDKCLANGLIYSIKSNGLLVFIPQYDIRGAVCLLNKDNKVAIVNDAVQWVEGSVEVGDTHLIVKAMDNVQKYSVFDKITVSINVQKPKAHQPKVVIELFSNKPHNSNHIKKAIEPLSKLPSVPSITVKPTLEPGTEVCDEKPSLYQLLLSFREITLSMSN